jgi:hypothetical protein
MPIIALMPCYVFHLAFLGFFVYAYSMSKDAIKQKLLEHPIVTRLLNNPNWAPAAHAAIAELVDGKRCPVNSWRKSSTWQQVQMVLDEIKSV